MSASLLELLFSADTKDLDEAKEKLVDLGSRMPTIGEGIEKLAESFKNLPGPIGLAAAAAVGFAFGMKEMIEGALESEIRILELSEAMGVSVQSAQPFIEAMALAGVSGEKLTASMSKLAQAVGSAITEPAGKAADAFKKLGISQDELKNGDTEQIMKDAATGLDQYADSATKTAVIRELFGKQGPAIVAAMQDEAAMEDKARQAQEDYGTAISETDAKSAKYFGETLRLGMSMFEGVALSITRSLLPGLQELVSQFSESGKQGGVMRDILDGIGTSVGYVGKLLIAMLVEPIRLVVEAFKEASIGIAGAMTAIGLAVTGHFGDAKAAITNMTSDLNKSFDQWVEGSNRFEDALWSNKQATDEWGGAVDNTKPKLTAFDANAKKVSDTLEELAVKLLAQHQVWQAAAEGLDIYKKAQDDVAVAAERLKIAKEGGSKQAQDEAEALMRAANADKQATSDEVAGWTAISRLIQQENALLSHNTELEKARAEIASQPGMTTAEKEELLSKAQLVDATKQQLEVDKEVAAFSAQGTKDISSMAASYTKTTNELKLYNQQMKLAEEYQKAIVGKTPEQITQIAAAYAKVNTEITETNQQTQAWTQSMAGLAAGAHQALSQMSEDAQNYNKLGAQAMTTVTNDLTNAFMEMGSGAKKAFEDLATGILKFIEQQLIHFAIVQAELAVLRNYGISGPAAAALVGGAPSVTSSANGNVFSGGNVVGFADGGVVTGPTMAPMALFGEAGPEAIMPLQRNSQGQLGVMMSGGTSGASGTTVHNHLNQVTINSNQDPHEIAKQAKKQMDRGSKLADARIANAQRPAGALNRNQHAFAN
jgi:lambda family phage tail tape measure protein